MIKVVLHSSSNRNWQNFMFFAANAAAIEGGGVTGSRVVARQEMFRVKSKLKMTANLRCAIFS